MRVLHSVLSLKPAPYTDIKIIWPPVQNFNCSIHELFKIPDGIQISSSKLKNKISHRFRRSSLFELMYDKVFYDQDIKKLRDQKYDFTELLNYSSVYIETCYWFNAFNDRFLLFEPIPEILERVSSITRNYNEHTVGIHIRRTDHVLSIKASPDSEFKRLMQREIERNNKTTFFLATDSEETELEMIQEFKDRIISRKKELSRNSPEGIKEAFVDMLCLSETKKIYGCYKSSFSRIASKIKNNSLEIVNILPNPD